MSRADAGRRWWLVVALFISAPLQAQAPNESWRSIPTAHFVVHYPAHLEALARRAGGEAERAWDRLARTLTPPRTPVELVVTDDRDLSNGQATYFPSNRIVVWARPPIDNAALRFSDDWLQQVVTHELAHVFHLDRSRGIWRLGQYVFGRHSALFPNARSPRWLSEGIAVAFESQYVGGGRLHGSELFAALDATVDDGRPITPGRLSIATPFMAYGNLPYFAGAAIVTQSRAAGGDSAVRRFIEGTAGFLVPYLWDVNARRAFGASFAALARAASPDSARLDATPARVLTEPYADARAPRWRGDTLFFVASGPRELTGLFAAHDGRVRRVADRNSTDAFAFAGPRIVYGDLEFTDPYHLYFSLYENGERIDGTTRVAAPDVRADGGIVAVDGADGAPRLVMLGGDGGAPKHPGTPRAVRALTARDVDVQWSDPRWSRSGTRIAASRWMRGGESDIVVLDTLGAVLASYARARAVQGAPNWDVNDRAIYFTSDRAGRAATYRIDLTGPDSGRAVRVASTQYGLYDAEISPDGSTLAAMRRTGDGFDVVLVAPLRGADAQPSVFTRGLDDPVVTTDAPSRTYYALRTLIPRYWIPQLGTSNRGNRLLGFYTSGRDAVERYAVAGEGNWDVKTGEFYGDAALTFYGFGRPVVTLGAAQSWAHFVITDSARTVLGDIARRHRTGSLSLTWTRQRVRNVFSFSAGGELEHRDFRANPDSLGDVIEPPLPARAFNYPSLLVSAGWSNARRSALAIGPERGMALSFTARRRWRTDLPDSTLSHSIIASGRAYTSLALGGHARHSLGVRTTAGWAEPTTPSPFAVGGVSGTSLELVPGYRIGDSQRSFFVRGFAPGAQRGIRAWAATAEYRAPLDAIGRGLWPLPFFFQRAALAVFADAGSAWCPALDAPTSACPTSAPPRTTLVSAGAELLLDATLDYDTPNRFRLGVAAPVRGKERVGAKGATVYFSLGLPF